MSDSRVSPGGHDALRKLIEAGQFTPMVERTWPLSEVSASDPTRQRRRRRGKIAVAM
jgi:hypothetical protein